MLGSFRRGPGAGLGSGLLETGLGSGRGSGFGMGLGYITLSQHLGVDRGHSRTGDRLESSAAVGSKEGF